MVKCSDVRMHNIYCWILRTLFYPHNSTCKIALSLSFCVWGNKLANLFNGTYIISGRFKTRPSDSKSIALFPLGCQQLKDSISTSVIHAILQDRFLVTKSLTQVANRWYHGALIYRH